MNRRGDGADARRHPPLDDALLVQGGYYLLTGAWPLLHMRSFEALLGRKREHWLVHTVGTLAIGIGATLATAALRRQATPEIRLLATLVPLGFAAVEVPNAARGRISPIYLVDTLLEAGFVLAAGGGGPSGSGGLPGRPGPGPGRGPDQDDARRFEGARPPRDPRRSDAFGRSRSH